MEGQFKLIYEKKKENDKKTLTLGHAEESNLSSQHILQFEVARFDYFCPLEELNDLYKSHLTQ